MNYAESLAWIHGRIKFGIKPGVKRMEWMLGALGHPEKNINGIHVVGTNGKGSTVSYLRNALNANQYTAGTFTSPYIETFNERISLDGVPIADAEIAEIASIVRPVSEEMEIETDYGTATEFEIITMMMFVYFGKIHPVDFVIIEAGLGAKNDSTNVFLPVMTILTSIGLDHTEILGDSLLDITKDKAAVIKPDVPLVFNIHDEKCREYVYKVLDEEGAPGAALHEEFHIRSRNGEFDYQYKHFEFENIMLTMMGEHQKENASLAITALLEMCERQMIKLDLNETIDAVENTTWSGRIEKIKEDPLIIIDGAHNREAMDVLTDTMRSYYQDRNITVLFSAVKGKPVHDMIEQLEAIADEFVVTEFEFFKSLPVDDIYKEVSHQNKRKIDDYLHFIDNFDGDILLITGSLYFISEVKQHFNALKIR
jgi:dihydrofolate synthase/folylpolyglutamate synthase